MYETVRTLTNQAVQRYFTDAPTFEIRAIGEIAIRCTDIRAMAHFYETILGVE